MPLKPEVGKTYIRRDGTRDKIIGLNTSSLYPFTGKSGCAYTKDGRYHRFMENHDWDLIREVQPRKKKPWVPSMKDTFTLSRRDWMKVEAALLCAAGRATGFVVSCQVAHDMMREKRKRQNLKFAKGGAR